MLKKVLYILSIAALSSCDDSVVSDNPFLNGVEKTPIETSALLDVSSSESTRAANKDFARGDKLLAYLRHVKWDGNSSGDRTPVTVNNSPTLVTFTKGTTACDEYSGSDITPIGTNQALGLSSENTKQTSDLTAIPALYWDDFSRASTDSEEEGAYDIRTSGHYLQSYYGYCFNGGEGENNEKGNTVIGNISAALVEETGVLGWKVPYDQTTQTSLTGCDLLWSAEQTPIQYAHGSQNNGGAHGTLVLPYTHAMSMVTVDVVAKDGFTTGALANTWLELQGMNKTCTVTAPTMTLSDAGQGTDAYAGKVKMCKGTPTTSDGKPSCTYQAIVVPGTALSQESVFLKIYDADGNNYDLKINSSILNSWNSGLTDNKMQSGYNYHLTVTINKVGVDVQSTLSDWKTVEAEGEGDIQFPEDDVTEIYTTTDGDGNPTGSKVDFSTIDGKKLANFKVGSEFTLYQKGTGVADTYTNVTTSTYNQDASSKKYWSNNPEIYWPNDKDRFFFRALAIYNTPATDGSYNIEAYTQETDNTVSQGTDYVWATTPAHKVSKTDGSEDATYAKSAAISPRTGDVPLAFEHVMSKITVKLATSTSGSGTPADAVELSGALISISKLATTGTIDIEDGNIIPGNIADSPISGFAPSGQTGTNVLDNYTVIPQTISDDAVLTIKLADGTTYKLQLNTCVKDGTTAPITAWLRGIHYTYTITLTKEAISFRVMIKNWDEKKGSGNANLDWD